jgi:formamidopyrimidine-DNA glycosylase
MPELAEVEFFRKQWHCGLGDRVLRVALHAGKRVFRRAAEEQIRARLSGARLTHSAAKGKQLLFRFSNHLWLGVHLGMTGKLSTAPPGFAPDKHDHLSLFQATRVLVFTDPRLFGCIRFDVGENEPEWWTRLPPPVDSPEFDVARMSAFLLRHRKLPIKSALLLQSGFPGVGNWMADEILWRAKIHPLTPSARLTEAQRVALWKGVRFVCRCALRTIGASFGDPPRGWLFHERWNRGGRCPIHRTALDRQAIGGRTTAWCPLCQPLDEPGLKPVKRSRRV